MFGRKRGPSKPREAGADNEEEQSGAIRKAGRKGGELQNVDLPVTGGFFRSTLVEIWNYGQARQRLKAYEQAVNAAADAHKASGKAYDAKIEHRRAWERLQRLDDIIEDDEMEFEHGRQLNHKKQEIETINADIELIKKRKEIERLIGKEMAAKGEGVDDEIDPEIEEFLESVNKKHKAVSYYYNKMNEEIKLLREDKSKLDEEIEIGVEIIRKKYADLIAAIQNSEHT